MNYRLSAHTIKLIGDRNIPIDWLEQVINLPEQVIEQSDKSKVYQSKFSNSHYGKSYAKKCIEANVFVR